MCQVKNNKITRDISFPYPYMCQMHSYQISEFEEEDLEDVFFDSLREDYICFNDWFCKKITQREKAYIYRDRDGIQAFLYIKKNESEAVGNLTDTPKMKIGTIKICDSSKGNRLGEGAICIALWEWQRSDLDQIYLTVFEKHDSLIKLLKDFGFKEGGFKGKEVVLYRDKNKISYELPKTSFPYIDPGFNRGGYVPIEAKYHDGLFPYSKLKNVSSSAEFAMAASNGITKIFIAAPYKKADFLPGDVIFIYRKSEEKQNRTYKSVVTSFCNLISCTSIKEENEEKMSLKEFLILIGNKSILTEEELNTMYSKSRNLYALTMLYNGFFGCGNNVNHHNLKTNSLMEGHPYEVKLNRDEIIKLMNLGRKNVQDFTFNKA